jgi:hypothetical protein
VKLHLNPLARKRLSAVNQNAMQHGATADSPTTDQKVSGSTPDGCAKQNRKFLQGFQEALDF